MIIIGTFVLLYFQLLELGKEPIGKPINNLLFGDIRSNNIIITSLFVVNCLNIINLLWIGYGAVNFIRNLSRFALITLVTTLILTFYVFYIKVSDSQSIICVITTILSVFYYIVSLNRNSSYVK